MARPNKSKRVWRLPLYPEFLTKGRETAANKMILSVEEFETLRLLDYLGMTQEGRACHRSESLYGSKKKSSTFFGGRDKPFNRRRKL